MRFLNAPVVRWLVFLVVITYVVVISLNILRSPTQYQWDFKTYLFAGRLIHEGGNPYDAARLAAFSQGETSYTFVYAPIVGVVLGLIPPMDELMAYYVFYAVKIICLVVLCYVWKKYFLQTSQLVGFLLILAFGFRETVASDLRSGNISIFEQLAIWISLIWYMKGDFWKFGGGIIAISLIKILPIVFLVLLLFDPQQRQMKKFLVCLLIFALLMLLQYVMYPQLFQSFITAVHSINERAPTNPSLLAAAFDASDRLRNLSGLGLLTSPVVGSVMYGAVAVVILAISVRTIVRHDVNAVAVVMIFCATLALTLPRFKDYSYVLMIIPATNAVTFLRHDITKISLIVLFCISLFMYQQLFDALVIWIILIAFANGLFRFQKKTIAPTYS